VPAADIRDSSRRRQSPAEPEVIAIDDCILHLSSLPLTRGFKFLKGFTGVERNGTSGRDVRGMDQ